MGHHQLDSLDYKILKLIASNARIPFLEVARECNVSGAAIHQRVQKLTNLGIIKGSEYTIDSNKIGFETCAYIGLYLQNPGQFKEVLEKLGICFLFAQKYHMSMKYVAPVRKMLGIRTIFNILGPLTNPAAATMQVMGVYEEALVRPMAEVLFNLGVKRGMVVYGQDCLDEISLSAPTSVCEIKDGTFEEYVITPEEFGMTRCTKEELVGGTPQENAEITKEILAGKKGPARDAVVLNAAAALHAAKEIPMQDAVKLAEELIDSGKAQKKLEEFVSLTNKLAEEE